MTDKGYEIIDTLSTKAKSTGNHEYNVHIVQGKQLRKDVQFKGLVLSIEDTPASWYVETLFSNDYGSPAIYYPVMSINGNDWLCINWQEVVKEMRAWLVANEYIYR
jgi:hypothetical protein